MLFFSSFTNHEDPAFKSDWGKYNRFVWFKKKKKWVKCFHSSIHWTLISSLPFEHVANFKIEKREGTLDNYIFTELICHVLIQTSNLLTAIYNAFLLACEQIGLRVPPKSQWHFVFSTLMFICCLEACSCNLWDGKYAQCVGIVIG